MAVQRLPAIPKTLVALEEEMIGSLTIEEHEQIMNLLQKIKGLSVYPNISVFFVFCFLCFSDNITTL